MNVRPLRSDEVAYLQRYRDHLAGTLQGAAIALGFLALPAGFLALTWASNGRANLGALVLAGVILMLLIAGVVGFSGRGWAPVASAWRALVEWRGLGEDMHDQEATIEVLSLTGKDSAKPAEGSGRVYIVRVGRRRFRISGRTWLTLAPDARLTLTYARHSGVVLEIDGEPERLPLTARAAQEEALAEE